MSHWQKPREDGELRLRPAGNLEARQRKWEEMNKQEKAVDGGHMMLRKTTVQRKEEV